VEQYVGAVFVGRLLCILRLDDVFFVGQDTDCYNISHSPAGTKMTDSNRETRWYQCMLGSWSQKTTLPGEIGGDDGTGIKKLYTVYAYFEFQPVAKAVRVRHK
jgi:hypothetical protein